MATGSADKTVGIWDTRSLKTKLYCLKGHTDVVNNVRFSKTQKNYIASSSFDRKINVWDLSRFDKYQTEEQKAEGPAELLFSHGGHTDKISDLDWNNSERLMLASVAEDDVLQIWQVG